MYALLILVIILLVPCSIVEVVCIRNAIRDRSDIPSSILFGFFEIVLIAGLVMTLSEWNTPIEARLVDADGKVINFQTERHRIDNGDKCITIYHADCVEKHCGYKSFNYRDLD